MVDGRPTGPYFRHLELHDLGQHPASSCRCRGPTGILACCPRPGGLLRAASVLTSRLDDREWGQGPRSARKPEAPAAISACESDGVERRRMHFRLRRCRAPLSRNPCDLFGPRSHVFLQDLCVSAVRVRRVAAAPWRKLIPRHSCSLIEFVCV